MISCLLSESNECLEREFQCSSGRCVPASRKCDSRPDCPNAEDELGCESECTEGEFLCSEGRCLPGSLRCDGANQCFNGEDEAGCDCDTDEFRCRVGGGCVMASKKCDG